MEAILAVTSKLAAPFDLRTMLSEVVSAAKQVLQADRGSVWLYDAAADQLVLEVAAGMAPVRVATTFGLAGACARSRQIINVPDCYADARFNPDVDKRSGYRTRCMLTLPLVDHKDVLVGVMQVLNKLDGIFDEDDEDLAIVLAAQCAVALQRVRMTEDLIEGEKMRQELETARVVQMGTLPSIMPVVAGYDLYGTFQPAELTGGDTFDLSIVDQGLLTVLADATGHGIAPRAVGHADARDAAHGVPPRHQSRHGLHAGQQPARGHPPGRSLYNRFRWPAGHDNSLDAISQRRPGSDPSFPGDERHLRVLSADELSPWARCASPASRRRWRSIWRAATSSSCSRTASTSTAARTATISARSACRHWCASIMECPWQSSRR